MCKEEFRIGPRSPFGAVDVVAQGLFLLVGNLGEEGLGSLDDTVSVDAFVFVVEEAFADNACGNMVNKSSVRMLDLLTVAGNTLEGFSE